MKKYRYTMIEKFVGNASINGVYFNLRETKDPKKQDRPYQLQVMNRYRTKPIASYDLSESQVEEMQYYPLCWCYSYWQENQ